MSSAHFYPLLVTGRTDSRISLDDRGVPPIRVLEELRRKHGDLLDSSKVEIFVDGASSSLLTHSLSTISALSLPTMS